MKARHIFSILLIALIVFGIFINVIANEVWRSKEIATAHTPFAMTGGGSGFEPYDKYYYPWLERPSPRVDMMPDTSIKVQPNTDEYLLLFHKIGPNPDSYLGTPLTNIGDQNGDGYDDIVFRNNNPDQVEFYYGGDPMDTIPDMIFFDSLAYGIGWGLTYGDNVNSNEHGILLMQSSYWWYFPPIDTSRIYLYNCGEEFDNQPDLVLMDEDIWSSSTFGYYNCIANINNDNFKDIITSNWNYGGGNNRGKIYIYYGGLDMDNIVDFTITSASNNFGPNFGSPVSCGDVNHDGFDDLFVQTDAIAYLFLGSTEFDSIPDWQYDPVDVSLNVQSLISIDINGDNYDDVILGIRSLAWSFFAVFFGGETLSEEPDRYLYHWPSEELNDVSYAGDVNNDGFDDLIASDYAVNSVFIHYGGDPPNQDADLYFYAEDGWVGYPGDVDGDGVDDIGFNDYWYEGQTYGQVFIFGDSTYSGISEYKPEPVIRNFTLQQNYPNPFNSSTMIDFTVNTSETVYLKIFDMLGRQVYSVGNSFSPGASISFKWDGVDNHGNHLSSGVYFLELSDEFDSQTRKVQIIR